MSTRRDRVLLCLLSVALYANASAGVASSASPLDALRGPASTASALAARPSVLEIAAGELRAYRVARRRLPKPALYHLFPPGGSAVAAANAVLTEGIALQQRPPIPSKPPVPWGGDPYSDRSWRYALNSLHWLEPVVRAYAETAEERYLSFAVQVVVDWHRQNVDAGIPNDFAWYDMAVGLRAPIIAFLVDAAARSDAVSDEDLLTLLRCAARHGDELRDPSKYAGDYNHGLYQMLGLLALARTLPEIPRFEEYGRYAGQMAERILTSSFTSDGVHLEHSPKYQLALVRTLEAVLAQGLLDTPHLRELHQLGQRALAWMVQPMGFLARIGDTEYFELEPRLLPLDHPLRDQHLLWVLTQGQQGRPPEATSWVAPHGGYAVLRSTWTPPPAKWRSTSYLIVHAGSHSRVHKHADDLTFEWSELGYPLLVDSGLFKYQPEDPRRHYCLSTRAHNTVEIDNRDYPLPGSTSPAPSASLTRWSLDGPVRALEAQVTHFGTVRHRRTLLLAPAQWLLVLDELSSCEEHDFVQWFHFDPRLDITQTGSGYLAPIADTGRVLHVQQLASAGGQEALLVRGQEEPRLQGWTSLQLGSFQPNWALGFRAHGKEVVLAALFALADADGRAGPREFALRVHHDHVSLSWRQDGSVVAAELDRSGAKLVVRLPAGPGSGQAEAAPPARRAVTLRKYQPVFRVGGALRVTASFDLPAEVLDAQFALLLGQRAGLTAGEQVLTSTPLSALRLTEGRGRRDFELQLPDRLAPGTYYVQAVVARPGAISPERVLARWATKVALVSPTFDSPALPELLQPAYLLPDTGVDLDAIAARVRSQTNRFAECLSAPSVSPPTNPVEVAHRFAETREYPLTYQTAVFSPGAAFWTQPNHPTDQLEVHSLRMLW